MSVSTNAVATHSTGHSQLGAKSRPRHRGRVRVENQCLARQERRVTTGDPQTSTRTERGWRVGAGSAHLCVALVIAGSVAPRAPTLLSSPSPRALRLTHPEPCRSATAPYASAMSGRTQAHITQNVATAPTYPSAAGASIRRTYHMKSILSTPMTATPAALPMISKLPPVPAQSASNSQNM